MTQPWCIRLPTKTPTLKLVMSEQESYQLELEKKHTGIKLIYQYLGRKMLNTIGSCGLHD